MKSLQNDIKNKSLNGIYVFTGNEDYLKILYKNRMIKSLELEENSINLTVFKDSIDYDMLFTLISTLPFGVDKKLIILENTGILSTEEVSKIMNAPEFCIILIIENMVDKRTKGYKIISKIAKIYEFNSGDEKNKIALINSILKKANKKMDMNAYKYIIDNSNDDLYSIESNINKVIDYVDGNMIELYHVEKVIPVKLSDKIFDMIRAITIKDAKNAVDIYKDLMLKKESPFKIIKLIYREYSILIRIVDATSIDNKVLAKNIGIHEFALRKYKEVLRILDKKSIMRHLDKCVELENDIKSGKVGEKLGLEKFILEILSS